MAQRRPPRPRRRTTTQPPRSSRHTAQAIPHRDAHYRELFENANDAIALFTLDGVIEEINRGAERLLGWAREELVGQPLHTIATPASVAVAEERTQRFLAGEKLPSSIFPLDFVHKDGHVIPVEARTRVIRDAAGKPLRFQGIFRDLTEGQRMQEALAQSEERYRSIFDACPDLVYVTDLTGRLLDANPALLEWQGLTLAALQQHHFLDFFAGDNEDELRAAFARLTQGLPVRELLVKAKNTQGEVREYEINARPLHDRQGAVTTVLSIARDVTTRREAERTVRESQRLRERIAEALPELVYVYDLTAQQTRLVNRQVTALLGYLPEEVHGHAGLFGPLLHPEDSAPCTARLQTWSSSEAGDAVECEYRVRHASGEYRWLRSRETVLTRGPEGAPQEILGLARDITDRKRLAHLAQQRTLTLKEVGQRIVRLRDGLRMTQAEFGAYVGEYNQQHVSNYETGRAEVPLDFILRLRARGHPLEVVLGEGSTEALEETVLYLATAYRERLVNQHLVHYLSAVLDRDVARIERVLRAVDRPLPPLSTEQRQLVEHLTKRDPRPEESGRGEKKSTE